MTSAATPSVLLELLVLVAATGVQAFSGARLNTGAGCSGSAVLPGAGSSIHETFTPLL